MSIERIRNYIIGNAQNEAEQIIKTAEEQFRNRVESARRSLEKQYSEMLRREEERLNKDLKNALILLKRDCRMKLLEIKNNVINEVLERALSHIQAMSDHDYLALLDKWLAKIPDHLAGQLFVNERDLKRITNDFIDGINKDRTARISLNTTAIGIKGGFIVKTEHYEIDYTLDTFLKNLRKMLTPELWDILRLSDVEL